MHLKALSVVLLASGSLTACASFKPPAIDYDNDPAPALLASDPPKPVKVVALPKLLPLDDRPLKLTIELSAAVHRDLAAYAEALAKETGHTTLEPVKLVPPMVARFMASDRAFAKAKRTKV